MKATTFIMDDKEAVRTSADRVAKEGRRMRREFNGTTQHLVIDPRIVEDLQKEGHLAWINDDLKGHIEYMRDIGYRHITNSEAYGERTDLEPDAKVKVRFGTANEKGDAQDIYLMLQPWDFYNEDQKAMDEQNGKLDQLISNGENDVDKSTGRTVQYATNKN
jgi:hypothetical protein